MNRDIKFRAWEKDSKVMFYSEDNQIDEYTFIAEKGGLKFYYIDSGDLWLMDTYSILMQFTGLTDKNGKEIYEGDILKRVDYPSQEPQYIVKFGEYEDSPDYHHVSKHIGWYVEDIEYQDEFNLSLAYVVNYLDCVVCGNIYENPELRRKWNEY